ncbi:MAG: hypothetical protein Q8K58_06950 [Acidimicrobiales bacterium]|nr:hypothetical protein [Acidimicrobiales bacterium]
MIPPLDPPAIPPPPAGPVPALLTEVRAELAQLRKLVGGQGDAPGSPAITGPELAATIEALGTTLGTGMASLLSDHRALLARDVEAAADRILEEVGQRLRTTGTQTVDAVEERIRHVSTKAMTDLSEQLELRLDQIQAEVTGLRAVMLEIPDQTVVSARLDQLAEAITSARAREARVSPAVTAAIGKALAGPIAQLETAISAVGDAVHELLDERLPEDLPDAAALDALTTEMTALRRRITLRTDEGTAVIDDEHGDVGEDEPDWADDDGWIEATPLTAPRKPAARKAPAVRKAPTKAGAVRGTRAAAAGSSTKATKAAKAGKATTTVMRAVPVKRTPRAR